MNVRLSDKATISGTKLTNDGFLVTEAFAVRTGIQLYTGQEVGRPDLSIVRVYRSEDEVRSPESLRTFSHAPVTFGHPTEAVTSDNWADLAVGEVSTEAVWDGNKIKLPLIVKDKRAIDAINAGTRELSAGYLCQLDWESGETADGEKYDAKQVNIRINHLAVVPKGRAGSECRIGDADYWGASPVAKEQAMPTSIVVIGDEAVQVLDTDAEKVKNYVKKILSDAARDMATKDAELAVKDAEIAQLKKAALSDADLDARVVARTKLLGDAAVLAPKVDFAGLSDSDIRKKAVAAVDANFANNTQAYIDAMFDVQVKMAKDAAEKQKKQDPAMAGFVQNIQNNTNDQNIVDFGTSAREQRLKDAYKVKE